VRESLTDILRSALKRAVEAGLLPNVEHPHWKLDLPRNPAHGDYATNLALVLASAAGMPPRRVAEIVVQNLEDPRGILAGVEVAGPGFINFRLDPVGWTRVLNEIETAGAAYGRSEVGAGRRVQVEFVSANPTGPLHVGHGRGAVVGDVLARVLDAAGFQVEREYYVNDAGNQMRTLGRSVHARYLELLGEKVVLAEDHYRGDYIKDLAQLILDEQGPRYRESSGDSVDEELGSWAGAQILQGIRADLELFGILFDRWFSERELHDSEEVDRILEELEGRGAAYRDAGALWLRTAAHGDEKDRVLVKGDGFKTYFASDIAYHLDKFRRGFDEVVDVWGADHHGYVPRMKAMLAAVGIDSARLQVLLVQFVNLLREGRPVGMSTRAGEFVTLREVTEEVGRDAARFLFLTRSCDAPLDFDLEVAKKQTADNPVFYVQYAHARISSLFREAARAGVEFSAGAVAELGLLDLEEEREILKILNLYPEVVEGAALNREPHRIVYFLQDLAGRFHAYYNKYRFLGVAPGLSAARLQLAAGVGTVIRNALGLLGVGAPRTM
jgi:arginyl-tRNA synthetase